MEGMTLEETLIRALAATTRILNSTTIARRIPYESKIQDHLNDCHIGDLVLVTHTWNFDPYQNVGIWVGEDREDGQKVYIIKNAKNEVVRWKGVELLKIQQEYF